MLGFILFKFNFVIFPGGSDAKESACNAGDPRLILGSRRSPEGNGNPLQYSCLKNSLDRGAWWATVHGVAKSWTHNRAINTFIFFFIILDISFLRTLSLNIFLGM